MEVIYCNNILLNLCENKSLNEKQITKPFHADSKHSIKTESCVILTATGSTATIIDAKTKICTKLMDAMLPMAPHSIRPYSVKPAIIFILLQTSSQSCYTFTIISFLTDTQLNIYTCRMQSHYNELRFTECPLYQKGNTTTRF